MKITTLLLLLILTGKLASSQDSLVVLRTAQGDTVVCLKPLQLKALNQQISLLSAHKLTCDYSIQRADSLIAGYKKNQVSLNQLIANKDLELSNKNQEI